MFGYGVNKKVLYTIFAILILYSLYSMTSDQWFSILMTLPAVIVAITFHEYAHAFVADRFGDKTPRNQGRLTLNPLSHLDPFGVILLIFAHIGWGKPVEINPNNFVNTNKSRGFCEAMVSLAGPLMNFIIAIIACFTYVILATIKPDIVYSNIGNILMLFLQTLIIIDIGLGVFNLIPLPPLDGEKIFRNILPYKVQEWLTRNYYTLYMVFMILWILGFLEIVVSPVIQVISNGLFFVVIKIVGLIL